MVLSHTLMESEKGHVELRCPCLLRLLGENFLPYEPKFLTTLTLAHLVYLT